MLIIMLSGKAGTGKNVVADILETVFESHNLDSHQFAFGNRVKETAKFMGWDGMVMWLNIFLGSWIGY